MKITKEGRKLIDDQLALVKAEKGEIDTAIARYNESLVDLKGMIEGQRDDAESEFEDKSEKWQEGDRGNAAREWIDGITTLLDSLGDEVEIEFPDLDDVDNMGDEPEWP